MGRDIVELRAESKWGSDFYNQLSLDLRTAFPNETGFSSANLRYMKRWYAFYNERVAIRQQLADEKSQQVVGQIETLKITLVILNNFVFLQSISGNNQNLIISAFQTTKQRLIWQRLKIYKNG